MTATTPSRGRRIAIGAAVVVSVILGINLLIQNLDRAVGSSGPGGVVGSSYATRDEGLAAYASLLEHYGYPVTQQRGSLVSDTPEIDSTLVVMDPQSLTVDETAAVLQFVGGGGRLVIGSTDPFYLKSLRDEPPKFAHGGNSTWTDVGPRLAGISRVETAGLGSWIEPGNTDVVVGTPSESLLTVAKVGAGEIWFLADPSALSNQYLGSADNAAFALALAGPEGRHVVFAEGTHGFGAHRGIAAIPTGWKIALVLLGAAALAFVWSRARRFGAVDHRARELPPARAEYVRALSLTLERTRDRSHALSPLQQYARDRIAARSALGATPTDDEIRQAARRFGCTDDEVAALFGPLADDTGVLALGRATARVSGGEPATVVTAGEGSGT